MYTLELQKRGMGRTANNGYHLPRKTELVSVSSIALAVAFIVFPILLILMQQHMDLEKTLARMDSGLFGESSMCISLSQDSSVSTLWNALPDSRKQLAIYSDYIPLRGITVRSIIFNGEYPKFLMLEGRFLCPGDFQPERYCAVIGKALVSQTYKRDNKRWIVIEGVEFEVLGILGYEGDTVFDSIIFINGMVQETLFSSKYYTFDFFFQTNPESYFLAFSQGWPQKMNTLSLQSGSRNYGSTLFEQYQFEKGFLFTQALVLGSLLLLSREWLQHKRKGLAVRRLLGAHGRMLVFPILRNYLGFWFISLVSGLLYAVFLHQAYLEKLVIAYAVYLPMSLLAISCQLRFVLGQALEEALKQ